jgi:hypothetical protein
MTAWDGMSGVRSRPGSLALITLKRLFFGVARPPQIAGGGFPFLLFFRLRAYIQRVEYVNTAPSESVQGKLQFQLDSEFQMERRVCSNRRHARASTVSGLCAAPERQLEGVRVKMTQLHREVQVKYDNCIDSQL